MLPDCEGKGKWNVGDKDDRITKVGHFHRKSKLEGHDIIRQTTKSLENKGFHEVSPNYFYQGCNLILKNSKLAAT